MEKKYGIYDILKSLSNFLGNFPGQLQKFKLNLSFCNLSFKVKNREKTRRCRERALLERSRNLEALQNDR